MQIFSNDMSMTIKEVIKQTEGRRLEFRRKVWFDSELVMSKPVQELNIENFKREYRDKTGEELDAQVLRKLELVKMMNGTEYPNNALILFSDDELRQSLFPFAKVECALFKGVTSEEFIDQKSISSNLSMQAEEAYNFVLRHINKGAVVEGVYTISHWEYPIKAIREAIRNAVVHRDYSLAGKDVKVAVYDDMVEITSPGLLPPSIDYAAMESRQSDARNKIIAPVFKRMGIIDQWGNGLKLIADELKEYPQIEFRWKEAGLSFQVQFVKIDYRAQQELQQEQQDLQQDLQQEQQDLQQELNSPTMYTEALCKVTETALSRKEISEALRQKRVSGQLNKILSKLIDDKLIEHTIPEIKNHPDQKFRITKRGVVFLALLKKQRYGER
jgi:predicted HTH transcriptional regulator